MVDPTWDEESTSDSENSGCVTLGYLSSHEQVAALVHEGELDSASLKDVIKELTSLCAEVQPNVNSCIVEGVKNKMPDKMEMT